MGEKKILPESDQRNGELQSHWTAHQIRCHLQLRNTRLPAFLNKASVYCQFFGCCIDLSLTARSSFFDVQTNMAFVHISFRQLINPELRLLEWDVKYWWLSYKEALVYV